MTPVVVQDPTWEQSFPAVGGIAIPFVAADGGVVRETWLPRREADRRRAAHEDQLPVAARPVRPARPRSGGDRQLGSRAGAARVPALGDAPATTPTTGGMTRTALVCVMAVLAVAGEAAAAEQLPRIDAQAPRSVGFADTFDYVVVATVPAAATARLTADVGPFSVVASTPLPRADATRGRGRAPARAPPRLRAGGLRRERPDGAGRAARPAARVRLRRRPRAAHRRRRRGTRPALLVPHPRPSRPVPCATRSGRTPPCRPSAGRSPTTATTALVVVALLSLVSAVALVVLATRRRGRADIDALARAVRLVRESAGRPEPDRRRAADLRPRRGHP